MTNAPEVAASPCSVYVSASSVSSSPSSYGLPGTGAPTVVPAAEFSRTLRVTVPVLEMVAVRETYPPYPSCAP